MALASVRFENVRIAKDLSIVTSLVCRHLPEKFPKVALSTVALQLAAPESCSYPFLFLSSILLLFF